MTIGQWEIHCAWYALFCYHLRFYQILPNFIKFQFQLKQLCEVAKALSLKAYLRYCRPRKKYKPEGDVPHRVWHISLRLVFVFCLKFYLTRKMFIWLHLSFIYSLSRMDKRTCNQMKKGAAPLLWMVAKNCF